MTIGKLRTLFVEGTNFYFGNFERHEYHIITDRLFGTSSFANMEIDNYNVESHLGEVIIWTDMPYTVYKAWIKESK